MRDVDLKEEPEPERKTSEAFTEKYRVVEEEEQVEIERPKVEEERSCWIIPLCASPCDW